MFFRYSLGKRLIKHGTLRKEQERLSENLLNEIKVQGVPQKMTVEKRLNRNFSF